MTLDDIQTDVVAQIQEQLSIKRWLAQEVPWYQSYMKSGLTMYLLFYMLQVRKLPISQQPPKILTLQVRCYTRSLRCRYHPYQHS